MTLFKVIKAFDIQNTQSGTQWDGLKHFGLLEHGVFYGKYVVHRLPKTRILNEHLQYTC